MDRCQWRLERKLMGICGHCSQPALPNRSRCAVCLDKDNRLAKLRYCKNKPHLIALQDSHRLERRVNRKCRDCGVDLMEGEGTKCMNCIFIAHHSGITRGGYK